MYTVRYDFKKAKITRARAGKVEITSIHMREIDGRDEELANNQAKARGGSATAAEELMRLAIVAVNDQPVQQPYLQFDAWNSRARMFAMKAFNEMNGYTKDEADSFLETAEEGAPQLSVAVTAPETE